MKYFIFLTVSLFFISCAGNKINNDRIVASLPQSKSNIKKIHSEKQEIDVPNELKVFIGQLVTKSPFDKQYEEKIKFYMTKENIHQSDWEAILWFVENSDTLDIENGYHTSSSIYLVRQSIGEGFHHGLNKTFNVVAKFKVELSYNYGKEGANEIKNGDAIITFLGFISQIPLKSNRKE